MNEIRLLELFWMPFQTTLNFRIHLGDHAGDHDRDISGFWSSLGGRLVAIVLGLPEPSRRQ